jgi:hypothetical protein
MIDSFYSQSVGQLKTITKQLRYCLELKNVRHRKAIIQRNHINGSLRAYLRLEINQFLNGVTPYIAKWQITKNGISEDL